MNILKEKIKKKTKDLEYKGKCIRMDERTWKKLKEKRIRSGLSWNKFLLDLIEK